MSLRSELRAISGAAGDYEQNARLVKNAEEYYRAGACTFAPPLRSTSAASSARSAWCTCPKVSA